MSYLDFVSCTSKVYDEVAALVHAHKAQKSSKMNWCIVSIDKVTNPALEEQFAAAKADILAKRGAVKEIRAFHGTSETSMAPIVADGFDPTHNRRSVYGRGTYVATDAAFARSYAPENSTGDNIILLCKVALGVPTIGTNDMAIDTNKYDYAVDNLASPILYAIPHRYAVIPQYVVQFYGKAV